MKMVFVWILLAILSIQAHCSWVFTAIVLNSTFPNEQVGTVIPQQSYILQITVADDSTPNVPNKDITRVVQRTGVYPLVIPLALGYDVDFGQVDASTLNAFNAAVLSAAPSPPPFNDSCACWWMSFAAPLDPSPGILRLIIFAYDQDATAWPSSLIGSTAAYRGFHQFYVIPSSLILRVDALFLSSSNGTYINLLGSPVANDSLVSADALRKSFHQSSESIASITAVLSRNASNIIYSNDDFETYSILQLPDSLSTAPLTPNPTGCWSSEWQGIAQVIVTPTRTLVLSRTGVWAGMRFTGSNYRNDLQNISWTLTLQTPGVCINSIFVSSQFSLFSATTVELAFATTINPVDIYFSPFAFPVQSGGGMFEKLLDSSNLGLSQKFALTDGWNSSAAFVVAVDVCVPASRTYLILLSTGNSSAMCDFILYSYLDSHWHRLFCFPRWFPISSVSDFSFQSVWVPNKFIQGSNGYTDVFTSTRSYLSFNAMEFAHGTNTDLYVWGSGLLYSPDMGNSFLSLSVLDSLGIMTADSHIVAFSTASTGAFIALTDSGRLWYGRHGRLLLAPAAISTAALNLPVGWTATMFTTVFFDSYNEPIIVTISNGLNGSLSVMSSSGAISQLLTSNLQKAAASTATTCPYSMVLVASSLTSQTTASEARYFLANESALPSQLFFDKSDSMTFTVIVVASPYVQTMQDLQLRAMLSSVDGSVSSRIAVKIQSLAQNNFTLVSAAPLLQYQVTLQDLAQKTAQSPPGQGYDITTVRLFVGNDSIECMGETNVADQSVLEPSGGLISSFSSGVDINVYSGCPPQRKLLLDPVASLAMYDYCVGGSEADACSSYLLTYNPVLLLADTVTGLTSSYQGAFTFIILGSGFSSDDMKLYSAAEIAAYNQQGSKSIWSASDSNGYVLHVDSSITWLCGVGSPCATVWPSFGKTPYILLKVQISTADANLDSYCALSTEFTLLLYGTSIDYITAAIFTLGVIGGLLLILFLVYIPCRQTYIDYKFRIQELSGKDDDDE